MQNSSYNNTPNSTESRSFDRRFHFIHFTCRWQNFSRLSEGFLFIFWSKKLAQKLGAILKPSLILVSLFVFLQCTFEVFNLVSMCTNVSCSPTLDQMSVQ